MADNVVCIKKYGNRRMYDTAGSRYVNLEAIAALIREGKEVQIVDAKTGKDLTRVTLTQIITEDARDKPTGLPLELLRQLILASDEVRQEFVMWYLKSAFDTYHKVRDAVQSRLGEVQSAIVSPMETVQRFLSTAPSLTPPPHSAPAERERWKEGRTEEETELKSLRRRVAELEARLKPSPRRSSRKKSQSTRKRST